MEFNLLKIHEKYLSSLFEIQKNSSHGIFEEKKSVWKIQMALVYTLFIIKIINNIY